MDWRGSQAATKTRPLRSLKLWLAFRTHGAAAFRQWIEGTLALGRQFADELRADEAFELLCEPTLSTVCFRHVADVSDLDAHNTALANATQEDGRVFLAPALVDGQVCLRACFVNFRTTPDEVPLVLDVAAELGHR